jgi:hypothetical protein
MLLRLSNLIKLFSALNSAFIWALKSESLLLLLLKSIFLNISSFYKDKDKGFGLKKAEKGY